MNVVILVTMLLLYFCLCRIPHIIWIYWNSGFEQGPLISQLCLRNLRHQLRNSDWEINAISDANLHHYLDTETLYNFLATNKAQRTFALSSDYIRILLLYRYGGVWIDSTVILLEDLNWLDHLASNPDVVNSDGEAPEVFQFYYSFFGSYNTRNIKGKEFLLSPGTESWFFASVKEAELLKLLIRQFYSFYKMGDKMIMEFLRNYKIELGYLVASGTYFMVYYAEQTVLQKTQREIDKRSLINARIMTEEIKQKGKYLNITNQKAQGYYSYFSLLPFLYPTAVQHYKLWTINVQTTPLGIYFKETKLNFVPSAIDKQDVRVLTTFPTTHFASYCNFPRYLIKMSSEKRKIINAYLTGNDTVIAQVDDELFWSRKWGIYLGCWSGLEVVEGSFVDKYLVSQMTKEERDKMRPLRKRDELGWGCGSTQFDADILLMVAMLLAIGIVLGMLGNFLKVYGEYVAIYRRYAPESSFGTNLGVYNVSADNGDVCVYVTSGSSAFSHPNFSLSLFNRTFRYETYCGSVWTVLCVAQLLVDCWCANMFRGMFWVVMLPHLWLMLCLVVYVWHSVSGVLTAREIWMLRLKIGMIIVYSCLMVMECRRRVRQGRYMFGDIVEIVMGVKEGVLMYVIVGYVESLVVERVLRKGGFK